MVQLSKAGMRETLKAGHPPAVKAGGKRVVKRSTEESSGGEREVKRADKSRSSSTPSGLHQLGLLLSAPLVKLGHDFPETPVSVRHRSMRPSAEKLHSPRTFCIQQPRKF